MNKFIAIAVCLLAFISFNSCEKDKGLLPNISFKTGGIYISRDTAIAQGTPITIGITASKSESEDVLKKFTVSKSVNGAAATTEYTTDLSGAQGDNYNYDFNTTLENVSGQINKYTFTVTNRDGLVNQVSVTITVL